MNKMITNHALEMSARLRDEFQIKIEQVENWRDDEWDQLDNHIQILADAFGDRENFIRRLGEVTLERTATGGSLGLAYRDRIKLSVDTSFSAWTIVHELAHVWDAKNDWKFSVALENFTGGYTNKKLSALKRFIPTSRDAGKLGPQKKPGVMEENRAATPQGIFMVTNPAVRIGTSTAKRISQNQLQCIADGNAKMNYPKLRMSASKDIFCQTEQKIRSMASPTTGLTMQYFSTRKTETTQKPDAGNSFTN